MSQDKVLIKLEKIKQTRKTLCPLTKFKSEAIQFVQMHIFDEINKTKYWKDL